MSLARLAREAELLARRLALRHPDLDARRAYERFADQAHRDATAQSKRSIPPSPWQEPKLKPVYDLFRAGQDAAREAGEVVIADCIKCLFGIWVAGRIGDTAPELAEQYHEALGRAGEREEP